MCIGSVIRCSITEGRGDQCSISSSLSEMFKFKCSMFRGMIERDRDIEERRRDEMAEKLAVFKREVKSIGDQS